ncbi:multicopper oxidase family protein, partial [Streptomyces sp. SID11233]|nr:multicopper oxidase family protein [Streptomyces sp. SID11233]
QIASDGGLLAAPVPAGTVLLSPGERAEVVVDFAAFAPGTAVVLENVDEEADAATRSVMRFDVGARTADFSRVPSKLS